MKKTIDMVSIGRYTITYFYLSVKNTKLIETFYESMANFDNSLGKVLKSMVFSLKSLGKVSISFETLFPIWLLIL